LFDRPFTAVLLCVLAVYLASALPLPGYAAELAPPDPRFGIVETFWNTEAATESGAGYTRIILRWDVIQPGGPDDWKPANVPDPFIEAELASGREVVAVLIGTPAWAARNPEYGARSVPQMDRWAAFTRRMAQHYRGRIRTWVIWNEPDVWEAGHPGATWAGTEADYAALLKTAYQAIKGVDANQQVLVAGLTYFWDWSHGRRRYLDRLLDVIARDPEAARNGFFFDAAVYHLYFNPAQTPLVLAETKELLRKHGLPGKPVWINETNAPPSDDPAEPPSSKPNFKITQAEQAAFILQELALGFSSGAARISVYKLRNSADHTESIEPYGLLRADDSRRPAFHAFKAASTHLGGFRTALRERSGDVTAVTFDRGDGTTTVLWTSGLKGRRVRVRAVAPQATLVDEVGNVKTVRAVQGYYYLDLPGAACTNRPACIIGGAPRLLVELGAPSGRRALP
jgi:hypothetical protein